MEEDILMYKISKAGDFEDIGVTVIELLEPASILVLSPEKNLHVTPRNVSV